MSLSLKITSYQRLTPSQQSVYKATSDSFTIGRNSDNDWAIPDPQRFLSGKHCRIHQEGGRYLITDTSTNGVFLNGSEARLERNAPVDLNPGDKFRIGDYEFEVVIEDDSMAGNPFTSDDETMIGADPFEDPFSSSGFEPEPETHSADDDFDDDDPFADSDNFDEGSADDDIDFLEQAEEPLSHMEDSPLGKAVSIDSLMGFDDDEDEDEEEPESMSDLENRRSPLHQSFRSSSVSSPEPEPKPPAKSTPQPASGGFDDIPDNWDEATGMFILPGKDEPFKAKDDPFGAMDDPSEAKDDPFGAMDDPFGAMEPDDEFADDWDATAGVPKKEAKREPAKPAKPAPPPVEEKKPAPVAPPKPPQPTAAPVQEPPRATQQRPVPGQPSGDAIAAFARGAGLETNQLAGIEQNVLFEQVGGMLVGFTEGLIQTLGGRTHIKSEFRLDQTMIRPAENNPFKFSTSKTRTLMQLLSKSDPAYKSGINAIKEGFDDVNAHQMAVVAGMEAALQDILNRFNPKTLETRLVSDSILDNILPGGKKAKYWDIFKLLFDEIAGEAEDNFQQLFGKEFSRAYEEQLDRLKNLRKESRQ